jgi:diacylglycerol kinase (ATP)
MSKIPVNFKLLKPDKSQHQKFSIRKRFDSFRFAFKGVRHALKTEHNFRVHIAAAVLVFNAGFFF